jgi:non-heme chloroperoxidase
MAFLESFDKTHLNYEYCRGEMPYTVIVLHGWGIGRIAFYQLFRRPLADFNLHMWDARNHGKSQIREQATISDLARDLRFFLTDIYQEPYPVIAIGHSMGAITLLEYISNYGTELISKIVLIDQSPKLITDEKWNLGVFGDLPAEKNEDLIRTYSSDVTKGFDLLGEYFLHKEFNQFASLTARISPADIPVFTPEASRGLSSIWKSFSTRDYRPVLRSIDVPTLLLYGEKSQFYLSSTGKYMQENIPGSRLVMFPRGDHSPFFAHEEEFFGIVKSFIVE